MDLQTTGQKIVAYRIPGKRKYPDLIPAPANREWMDVGTKGWANRCLPLRIANQNGWFLLNDTDFEVVWGGLQGLENLKIMASDPKNPPAFVSSMFGHGILTFTIPYLFRLPQGFNMMVRGPANLFKDGACPLEGVVEGDWAPYTFTMNWQVTRRLKPVRFQRGEPFCMLTPIRRGDVDSFCGEIRNLEADPELLSGYQIWHERRMQIVEETRNTVYEPGRAKIQGNYIRGEGYQGERGENHQTKLTIRPFIEAEPAPPVVSGPEEPQPSPKPSGWWHRLRGK